ncbi:DUF4065 domain-containing protein [Oceanobacillus luteolus]|uniref:Panacea domain-containing protein n=1 Tax=Oceanobacillus luteolus TaxID=1274358 RepID=UPI00203C49B8|nr:type II toxin-antitoxin system antitoxin SocA domain-containing protein [Oceanobacillus luteolus]MCM3739250.1 DUF4065 domain-containing protein [Oceanobacillus luteolus]
MPRSIIEIAGAINTMYEKIYAYDREENDMTEMKMHKLLYFAQKQHYQNFGEWLFENEFEGWVHGPVNKEVRRFFECLPTIQADELTLEEEYTIREVLHNYGKYSAYHLRELSHQDEAYKASRRGLSPNERGEEIITKENIVSDIAEEQAVEQNEIIYQ